MASAPDVEDEALPPIEVTVQSADRGECAKALTITVPAAAIQKVHNGIVGELGAKIRLPGFRPGKVPRPHIERMFKSQIHDELRAAVIARAVRAAINQLDVKAIGTPKIDVAKVVIAVGADVTFEAEVEVRPAVTLGNYKGLPVEREETEVLPEEVAAQLEGLARRQAEVVDAPAGSPVQAMDLVTANLRVIAGEQEVASLPERPLYVDREHVVGAPVVTLDGKVLEGAQAGEKRTAAVTLSPEFEREEWRGKDASLEIEVKSIRRPQVPPVDDELAKKAGAASLDELRQKITDELREHLSSRIEAAVRNDLVERVVASSPFPVPPRLLEDFIQHRTEDYGKVMERMGLAASDVQERISSLRERATRSVEQEVRTFFVLDAVAQQEKLEPSDEDMDAEVVRLARERKVRPAELYEQMKRDGELDALKRELSQKRAVDFLVEHAAITFVPRKKPGAGGASAEAAPAAGAAAETAPAADSKPAGPETPAAPAADAPAGAGAP